VYAYDADGNRVAKGTIPNVSSLYTMVNGVLQPTISCDPAVNGLATSGNETDYVLGLRGEQVTERAQDANGSMNWQRTYVYAAGALFATFDPSPDTLTQPLPSYRLTDWLGTLRATTDSSGVSQGTCTGSPFGDGVSCKGDIPDVRRFTGKERDTESGNDYFGARYYASSMGRFMSPDFNNTGDDPQPIPYADLEGPQSLNLYSYVGNNPLYRRDADGHSYVVYDGSANTLTLYSGTGERLGVYPADNNVDSHSSLGKLPDGTYPVLDQNSPNMHGDAVDPSDSNLQDSEDGEFGPGGIFRIQAFRGPDGKSIRELDYTQDGRTSPIRLVVRVQPTRPKVAFEPAIPQSTRSRTQ